MKQNKYDDPGFFAKYSKMPRSIGGLNAAGEWPAFRALLPSLQDKKVLDLGCGFGWHCRYAREQGARSVVGIDLSEKMLARARAFAHDPAITYRRLAIEDMDFPKEEFGVVISSITKRYAGKCMNVFHPGERSSFRSSIRFSPHSQRRIGITGRRGNGCTGRSTTTSRKARGKQPFWTAVSSNTTVPSLPLSIRLQIAAFRF